MEADFLDYKKKCDEDLLPSAWVNFKKVISAHISLLNSDTLFKHYIFSTLLTHIRGIECENAAIAFDNLELYTRLLYRFPWKYEYRTLKTYNGFYSTMIDKLMPCNREILKMLGYIPNNESVLEGNVILELAIVPTSQTLLTIGFDCLVASAQCKLRQNTFSNNMKFRTIDYKASDNDKRFAKHNKLNHQDDDWDSSGLEKTLNMSQYVKSYRNDYHDKNRQLKTGCRRTRNQIACNY